MPFLRMIAKVKRCLTWLSQRDTLGWLTLVVLALQWHTLDKTDQTLKAELRAWLGTTAIELSAKPQVGELLATAVNYENFGREPATDADLTTGTGNFTATIPANVPSELVPRFDSQCVVDGSDPEGRATGDSCKIRIERELAACRKINSTSGGVIFPGKGSFPLPIGKDAMRNNINTPSRMVLVTGCFTYISLNKPHYSAFCYFYRGGQPDLHMKPCPVGNEAN